MDWVLEKKLLAWINDEVNYSADSHERLAVSISLLMVRLAAEETTDTTQSTAISLKAFAQASLERALKELHKKNLITFVDANGSLVPGNQIPRDGKLNLSALGYVALTDKGREESAPQG